MSDLRTFDGKTGAVSFEKKNRVLVFVKKHLKLLIFIAVLLIPLLLMFIPIRFPIYEDDIDKSREWYVVRFITGETDGGCYITDCGRKELIGDRVYFDGEIPSAPIDYLTSKLKHSHDNRYVVYGKMEKETETAPSGGSDPTPTTEEVITNPDPEHPSYHYSTFFHGTQNYALTNDGTVAFVADLSGSDLVLTKIAEGTQVIPANTAVIFRKSGSADPVVLNPTEENGVSFSANNDLLGVDVETAAPANCYVLSGTDQYGVGFYRINGNTLKAHKAYVKYTGLQNNAPRRMRFVFDTATDIDHTNAAVESRKVLENGVLYIIKNGVRYNAQGQLIK